MHQQTSRCGAGGNQLLQAVPFSVSHPDWVFLMHTRSILAVHQLIKLLVTEH
jgi:hypothetical protein